MVICLERVADLHISQLMPLPLTVSCFSKIQIGFTFLVLAHPGGPEKRAVKWVCVCVRPEALCFQVVCLSGHACVLNGEFLAVDLRGPIYEIAYDSSYDHLTIVTYNVLRFLKGIS